LEDLKNDENSIFGMMVAKDEDIRGYIK